MLFYVKSLEEDLATKTLVGKEKEVCQTLNEIFATKLFKPNTVSFGSEKRLSTTILHPNYLETYREQGIIFQTEEMPEYVLPGDLIVLTETNNPEIHYYKIKDDLHIHYNHKLIPGFERFVFENIDDLVKKYPTIDKLWSELNNFRQEKGFLGFLEEKKRLVMYNEAVFTKPIAVVPVALYGKSDLLKQKALEFKLPIFEDAKTFYLNRDLR